MNYIMHLIIYFKYIHTYAWGYKLVINKNLLPYILNSKYTAMSLKWAEILLFFETSSFNY